MTCDALEGYSDYKRNKKLDTPFLRRNDGKFNEGRENYRTKHGGY